MVSLGGFIAFISCVFLLVVNSSLGSEIINGKEVKPHSMPFMALLENQEGPACGGILIGKEWVLTAAHCSIRSNIQKVLLGVHSYKEKKDSWQVREVKKHVPHPCFDLPYGFNDLMLLKLNQPVKPTKTVDVHNFNESAGEPAAGSTCLVAGWGQTSNKINKMSDVLMSVNVTVIDRKKCNKYYSPKTFITKSMICAGSNWKKNADSCQGDSGGPLLCNGVLVGITSFGGSKCGSRKKPGVYALLTKHQISWIKKEMKAPASPLFD